MIIMLKYAVLLALSFAVTYLFTKLLIPRLKRFGMTGKDINKPGTPETAEMGGIAIVAGITAGMLFAVFLNSFFGFGFNLLYVLSALITIHSIAFIGIVDDLLDVPQWLKALLPLFAAVPLIALKAVGSTAMIIPFVGTVELGILYLFVLIPLGIAVSSNLTNMLAGFNGMESGMGIVMFLVMSLLALNYNNSEMLVVFVPMLGALCAFYLFNRYPAQVFPGDIGNLTIGAVLASGVIIGNLETAGAILMVPYAIDFFIKLANKFPSKNWWGVYKEGKLYPVDGRVRGFAQLVMKKANGISEQNLSLFFIACEAVAGIIVLLLYYKF